MQICRGTPVISHLLFADDSFLFMRAHSGEFLVKKEILSVYEKASGQAINMQKSEIIFGNNVPQDSCQALSNILGVS